MNLDNLTYDELQALDAVAAAQLRGESLEHAAAAASVAYQAAQHRNDGGDDSQFDSHCPDWQCV